jgi:hypothetical protein
MSKAPPVIDRILLRDQVTSEFTEIDRPASAERDLRTQFEAVYRWIETGKVKVPPVKRRKAKTKPVSVRDTLGMPEPLQWALVGDKKLPVLSRPKLSRHE